MTSPGAREVRHFLRDDDLSPAEQAAVLTLAAQLKADRLGSRVLAGPRTVALLFDKPSLRTRVSFAVGVAELGGYPLLIDAQGTHAGRGESIADMTRVLASQVAAIAWRTFGQERVEQMAAASSVPVVNALTDEFHPCQVLADLLTIKGSFGRLAGLTLTFLGDGSSNMANSYLLGGATAGLHVRICAPEPYWPSAEVVAVAAAIADRTGGSVSIGADPADACKGADVLATDVWTSMGRESEAEQRRLVFSQYQVSSRLMAAAGADALFMHCLPAHRGEEVTTEVLESSASIVFDQAENRLHSQKALLLMLLG